MAKYTDKTLEYYDQNAAKFAGDTVDVEFSQVQQRFENLLAPGARVLDFGCGSGRDAKRFVDDGFDVTAADGSPVLCAMASAHAGIPVRRMLFQELDAEGEYDGVWACSSILHLAPDDLAQVLGLIARALVPGGVLYTSFKYGDFRGMRGGRWFTNFTEDAFRTFITQVPQLAVEQLWVTSDVRPGRGDEKWLNLILRRS